MKQRVSQCPVQSDDAVNLHPSRARVLHHGHEDCLLAGHGGRGDGVLFLRQEASSLGLQLSGRGGSVGGG